MIKSLDHGYGVLRATLVNHHRDSPDAQGSWYHVNLIALASGIEYRAAVDVDSKQSAVGVRWKVIKADSPREIPIVANLPEGFHSLASSSTSGALDHIRHRLTALLRIRWTTIWFVRLPWLVFQPWKSGSQLQASAALESILVNGAAVLVWGEPFLRGFGVHNVHQNQGDPVGSQWWPENGVWQDGAVAAIDGANNVKLFISKFSSQSLSTDAHGHPL